MHGHLLLRHEEPQEKVGPETRSRAEREDEEQNPNQKWVDVEVFGQSSAHPGNLPVNPAAMKLCCTQVILLIGVACPRP